MLKIGLVGGTKFFHARVFSEMFNGYDKKEAEKKKWPLYYGRVRGARISHVWDINKKDAEELANVCNVENVVSKKEDMIGKVDGVIIPDDCTMKHQRRADPFLREGMPVFIDKPLSPDIKDAKGIIRLARKYNAPLMSCSALRYAREIERFKKERIKIGKILTGSTIGPGDLVFYGIHAFEQLYSVIGPGVKSVRHVGKKDSDIVVVKYNDGRKFILTVYKRISSPFQMNFYGTKGWAQVIVKDANYYYSNMLKHFVTMVKTKKEPFLPEEILEIVKVLALGKKSGQNGKELKL